MRSFLPFLYLLTLSLWVGGMVLFTFVVTPAVFRSFGRDEAGRIVGALFDGYFLYALVLSGAALLLFFLLRPDHSTRAARASLVLLTAALLVNTYVSVKLHPAVVRVKEQVVSFENEPPDSPARKTFTRLHAVSAVLNLFVLLDGAALLYLGKYLSKP